MNRYASILLPLDGSTKSAKGVACGLWLAETLGATLHVLHAAAQPFPCRDALARLHVAGAQRAPVVLHQRPDKADAAVLEAIVTCDVDLVVMSGRGESASSGLKPSALPGTVARAVIERSPVPVVLIPTRYREVLPWTSMLAAASGEIAADRALEAATRLAAALKLMVTVVHAVDGPVAAGKMPLGAFADAAHHEYPGRLRHMVERGLCHCTQEESCCVNEAVIGRGDPAAVLLEQVAVHASSVLALGWHGAFGTGHALVLKRLLEQAECALLLMRGSERSTARLKVEEEIDT